MGGNVIGCENWEVGFIGCYFGGWLLQVGIFVFFNKNKYFNLYLGCNFIEL